MARRRIGQSSSRSRAVRIYLGDFIVFVSEEILFDVFPNLEHFKTTRGGGISLESIFERSRILRCGRATLCEMESACRMLLRALTNLPQTIESFTLELTQTLDRKISEQYSMLGRLLHGSSRINRVILCLSEISGSFDSFLLASIIHAMIQSSGGRIMTNESQRDLGIWVLAIQLSRMNDVQAVTSYRLLLKANPELTYLVTYHFKPRFQAERDAIFNLVQLARSFNDDECFVNHTSSGKNRANNSNHCQCSSSDHLHIIKAQACFQCACWNTGNLEHQRKGYIPVSHKSIQHLSSSSSCLGRLQRSGRVDFNTLDYELRKLKGEVTSLVERVDEMEEASRDCAFGCVHHQKLEKDYTKREVRFSDDSDGDSRTSSSYWHQTLSFWR